MPMMTPERAARLRAAGVDEATIQQLAANGGVMAFETGANNNEVYAGSPASNINPNNPAANLPAANVSSTGNVQMTGMNPNGTPQSAGINPGLPNANGTSAPGGLPGTPDVSADALNDPEYLLAISQLEAALNNQKSQYEADQTSVRGRYGRQLREAGQRLPDEIKGMTESAAARGMYHSGGRLEALGDINKRFADFNAQIGEDETSELSQLTRGWNTAQSEAGGRKQTALLSAVQRASARAQERAAAKAALERDQAEAARNANGGVTPGSPGNTTNPTAPATDAAAGGTLNNGVGGVAGGTGVTGPGVTYNNPSYPVGTPVNGATGAPVVPNPQNIQPISQPMNLPGGVAPNAPGGSSYVGAPTANSFAPGPTAPTQAAPKPPVQREMSSFSSKDQTVLSLGGTVKLGGVIPAKYNPLTGKVEPI